MGLLDILNGMQNGPHGQAQPQGGRGGMSPLTMALLGVLAFKALKALGGQAGTGQPAPTPSSGTMPTGNPGGGLGDILGGLLGGRPSAAPPGGSTGGSSLNDLLRGGLGGLLGGASAGNVLSGGLGELIKDLQASGHGDAARSWVGNGPNQAVAPGDLAKALGADTVDALAQRTGMTRDDLLNGLSQNLPELVDKLTPNGRLPSAEEAARMV